MAEAAFVIWLIGTVGTCSLFSFIGIVRAIRRGEMHGSGPPG